MTPTFFRRLLVLAVLAASTAAAPAQPAELPQRLAAKVQLSAADADAIDAFLDAVLPDLGDDDLATRRAAHRALLDPLAGTPSPSFRIQYGAKLKGVMTRLAASAEENDAVFGVLLAGQLATVDGHAVVLTALDDPRAAVRYAAARGVRVQLASLASPPAALGDQHREALTAALADRVALERDPVVLDGLLTAATESVARDDPWCNALLQTLSEALAQNVNTGEPGALGRTRAYLRLVGAAQLHFRNHVGSLPASLGTDAALLAGHVMGYVVSECERPESDPAATDALGQLLKAAHNLAFFANDAAGGPSQQANSRLPDAFDRWRSTGDASALQREAEVWIGPAGVLSRPPYSAAPGTFSG